MGRYQLLIINENWPQCPASYGDDVDCRDLFQKILDKHPPIRGNSADQVANTFDLHMLKEYGIYFKMLYINVSIQLQDY